MSVRNHLMYSLTILLPLAFISHDALASTPDRQYVIHHENIESMSKHFSAAQCQEVFADPLYYTIANDKPIYEKNKNLIISAYQRTKNDLIDKDHQAYAGTQTATLIIDGTKYSADINVVFTLDKNAHTIAGTWSSPGYCKGTLTGQELN